MGIKSTKTAVLGLSAAAAAFAPAAAGNFEMFAPESEDGKNTFIDDFRAAPAVRAGDFVYISGVVGYIRPDEDRTPEAYEAAIRDTFNRVAEALAPAGADWGNVIEMTTFHVGMREHQEIFRKVREEFVAEKPYPAWTGVGVEKLWADPLFVEIRVVAYVGE